MNDKKRFKLYKSGKLWVIATVIAFGAVVMQNGSVSANGFTGIREINGVDTYVVDDVPSAGNDAGVQYDDNGQKANGLYQGLMYQNGYLVLHDEVAGIFYVDGKVLTGSYMGKEYTAGKLTNGFENGSLYKDGDLYYGIYSDGLDYVDGKPFTGTSSATRYQDGKTINGVVDGLMYQDGRLAGTFAFNTTINGVLYDVHNPGHTVQGIRDGILYEDGLKVTGLANGIMYKDGTPLTGFAKDGKLYQDGKLESGLYLNVAYKNGVRMTGALDGVFYINGNRANQVYKGVLYKDGMKFTGIQAGKYYTNGILFSGKHNDILYKDGIKFTGQMNKLVYTNGRLSNAVYKGVLYENGKPMNGVAKNLKMYKNGKLYSGWDNYIFYKNGDYFTGVYQGVLYKAGKKFDGFKNGKRYRNGLEIKTSLVRVKGKLLTGINKIDGLYYKSGKLFSGKKGKVSYISGAAQAKDMTPKYNLKDKYTNRYGLTYYGYTNATGQKFTAKQAAAGDREVYTNYDGRKVDGVVVHVRSLKYDELTIFSGREGMKVVTFGTPKHIWYKIYDLKGHYLGSLAHGMRPVVNENNQWTGGSRLGAVLTFNYPKGGYSQSVY